LDKAYSFLMRELWGSPIQWNTKKSYLEVAKKLGVDEETVRNRVKRLRETGFLLGWRLVPNPMLLGRASSSTFLSFNDSESREHAISQLTRMDGVINIASIYDKSLTVTIFDDEQQNASKQVTMIGMADDPPTTPSISLEQSKFRMTPLDWEIADLLLKDADKKLTDVARQLRVSARTVKRRLNTMMKESAVFIMPLVDLRKSEGVSYQLMIQSQQGKSSEVSRLVASKIDNLVFRADNSKNGLIFGFTSANVAEGNDLLNWVKAQAGVKVARLNIVEKIIHVYDWLEREVQRYLSKPKTTLLNSG
jgi:DNA-binding Lrp family transcriptional regulator